MHWIHLKTTFRCTLVQTLKSKQLLFTANCRLTWCEYPKNTIYTKLCPNTHLKTKQGFSHHENWPKYQQWIGHLDNYIYRHYVGPNKIQTNSSWCDNACNHQAFIQVHFSIRLTNQNVDVQKKIKLKLTRNLAFTDQYLIKIKVF